MTGAPLIPDAIEHVARKLYEQEVRRSSLLCVPWEELAEEERDDVRHQVRSVLAIVEDQEALTWPGLLGLPPSLASPPTAEADHEHGDESGPELWLRTGS
jgi:hypothetical protein